MLNQNVKKRIIAVCGKGGTGKTVSTAIMARVLKERDNTGKLLLIDADPAMGLKSALGIEVKRTMGMIREQIIKTAGTGNADEKAGLAGTIDYKVLEALSENDGYAFLAMGRTETLGCFCPVNKLLRGAIKILSNSFETIFIDGEAGLEQLNRQVVEELSTLLIISDPSSRGIETAAMVKRMIDVDKVIKCERIGIIFNRVIGNEDLLRKAAETIGLTVFGFVPYDENIASYDLVGKPITELPSGSVGLAAYERIMDEFVIK